MAGAYAGAVAGAMAGALSARGGGVASIFRSPEKSSSMKGASKPPPPSQTRSGGHRAPPKAPDEPASPQNAMPRNKSVGSVSTASGEVRPVPRSAPREALGGPALGLKLPCAPFAQDEHDLELELAKTLTIEEFISKSGAEQHIGAAGRAGVALLLLSILRQAADGRAASPLSRRGAQGDCHSLPSEEAAVDIPVFSVREEYRYRGRRGGTSHRRSRRPFSRISPVC